MPSVEAKHMNAALFVEISGKTYRVTLPSERMEVLLSLAGSLFDDGKLGLAKTSLFSFEAVRAAYGAPETDHQGVSAAHPDAPLPLPLKPSEVSR